jgi:hypothetical protein
VEKGVEPDINWRQEVILPWAAAYLEIVPIEAAFGGSPGETGGQDVSAEQYGGRPAFGSAPPVSVDATSAGYGITQCVVDHLEFSYSIFVFIVKNIRGINC